MIGRERSKGAAEHHSEEIGTVLQIARTIAATIGSDFFRAITKHLAIALSADCVILGEFIDGPMEGVRTLGAYLDGVATSFEYELAGSAAAVVATGRPCACRSMAQSRFPTDSLLPIIEAEALVGVPLQDSRKQPVGLMMAFYRHPVESFHTAKQLLDIFSARASAELNRKREEDRLRECEERYRAFIATNVDGMWRIEFERPVDTTLPPEEQLDRIRETGYVAECNDSVARFLGRESSKQLLGTRIKDLTVPWDSDAALRAIQAGYKLTTIETSRLDPSGRRQFFQRCQWGIVEDGKLQRIWGTTRDISDLRYSERARDASEQRMADLIENMQLVVFIADTHGDVSFCNNSFYRITGWTTSDVLGKPWLPLLAPSEEHPRLRGIFEQEIAKPEVPVHFQSTLLGPNARRWHYEWDRAALRDADGAIAAWAHIGRDVTEQRAMEEQLIVAQKLATIGKLAAGIAHDFNNLLTVILGASVSLLNKLDPAAPGQGDLDRIRNAATKGAELTHRLLAFGRSQALRPEILSPNVLIEEAAGTLEQLVGREVRLSTNLDPSTGLVQLDPASFHQALMNLAVNARDAMPAGGELTISTSNTKIEPGSAALFPAMPAGEYVMITVSDTGTGMTDDVLRHIFEPFFTTKEASKGVGLGLSTVYGFVRQSGGRIFVETEAGRGTTIRILFYRVQTESAPS
jgi:hypothetical protein